MRHHRVHEGGVGPSPVVGDAAGVPHTASPIAAITLFVSSGIEFLFRVSSSDRNRRRTVSCVTNVRYMQVFGRRYQ